jgi:hypothetical protein
LIVNYKSILDLSTYPHRTTKRNKEKILKSFSFFNLCMWIKEEKGIYAGGVSLF